MDIVFILVPLTLLLALLALGAYFWAVKSGQFDDLETPSLRVLFDDEDKSSAKNEDKEADETS